MQCMNEHDKKLWEAVVAAEQQVTKARAAFFQEAESRATALAVAFQEFGWNQRAALSFIGRFPDDAPELISPLVEFLLSSDWEIETAGIIREALRRKPEIVTPKLRDVVRARLDAADAEDYGTLAALLQYIGDNEMLAESLHKPPERVPTTRSVRSAKISRKNNPASPAGNRTQNNRGEIEKSSKK